MMHPASLPIGSSALTNRTFSIGPEDRRKHMALFGKSGVGKTTLLRNMAAFDLHAGHGLTVLDPHGSLVEDLLNMIPKHRTNDVIYLDPQAYNRVLGLNPLERVAKEQRALVVSSLVSIMRTIWASTWGPRTEFILSNVAFALLEQPQPMTLLAIPKLLTDSTYRAQIVRHVADPAVQWFFRLYESWPARLREEAISPLLNKVTRFITNPLLRSIIGQPTSSFAFRWLMDKRKILLCRLPKGALGEDVSSLLGSLVVTQLSLAAMTRQDMPEAQRQQHILYADEVQNFALGIDLGTILAEARKYRLALVLATQTIDQLPHKSVASVFGNCATLISFRVGGQDARTLMREFGASHEDAHTVSRQFGVVLPAAELQDLEDFKAYIRTLSSGRPSGPHLLNTFPPFERTGTETASHQVIQTSLERFGRSRAQVEARLNRFLAS